MFCCKGTNKLAANGALRSYTAYLKAFVCSNLLLAQARADQSVTMAITIRAIGNRPRRRELPGRPRKSVPNASQKPYIFDTDAIQLAI